MAEHAKRDARKIRIVPRLRAEAAVTLKSITKELYLGTWTHVSNLLSAKPSAPSNQTELNLCQYCTPLCYGWPCVRNIWSNCRGGRRSNVLLPLQHEENRSPVPSMTIEASITPVGGALVVGVILLFMATLCYSYFHPALKPRLRWLGQWNHMTPVGLSCLLCALALWAIVVAGNAWKIEIIQKRNLLLLAAAFAVGFAGWLYDRCVQK